MLVLSRKQGERIQIGENIVLTITQIKGNRVSVGFDAPREVDIRRGELGQFELESHRFENSVSLGSQVA